MQRPSLATTAGLHDLGALPNCGAPLVGEWGPARIAPSPTSGLILTWMRADPAPPPKPADIRRWLALGVECDVGARQTSTS